MVISYPQVFKDKDIQTVICEWPVETVWWYFGWSGGGPTHPKPPHKLNLTFFERSIVAGRRTITTSPNTEGYGGANVLSFQSKDKEDFVKWVAACLSAEFPDPGSVRSPSLTDALVQSLFAKNT